ncbi:MAG: hypothetical protein ACI9ON_001354 [Limisphaerales bacterium]|jgi:hypothetical protein
MYSPALNCAGRLLTKFWSLEQFREVNFIYYSSHCSGWFLIVITVTIYQSIVTIVTKWKRELLEFQTSE